MCDATPNDPSNLIDSGTCVLGPYSPFASQFRHSIDPAGTDS